MRVAGKLSTKLCHRKCLYSSATGSPAAECWGYERMLPLPMFEAATKRGWPRKSRHDLWRNAVRAEKNRLRGWNTGEMSLH